MSASGGLKIATELSLRSRKKRSSPFLKTLEDLRGRRVGVIGRTQVKVTLLRVILTESGINPKKVPVTQFSTSQVAEMVRDPTIDAFMTVGPLDSKITSDAIILTARLRGEPTFLPIDATISNGTSEGRIFCTVKSYWPRFHWREK